jgi:hypothetical protein
MRPISNNTYRVLGVASNTSLKGIQKNISKLKAFAKIGKEMKLDYDLSFLNLAKINRTNDILLISENKLLQDKNKITSSLFWFADLSPVDSVAIANLIKGDTDKSINVWSKATKNKEVNSKNYSSFNNLSTLLLLNTLDDSKTDTFRKDIDSIGQIKSAIKLKNQFISSPFFLDHCESISKSNPINTDDAQEFFATTILDLLNKNFSSKELSGIFEGLDEKLQDVLITSLTETPISNIKNHIETASSLVDKNSKSGIKVGKKLIKSTRKDIKFLKEVFDFDDFQFQSLSDKLSNQILQCGIVAYNSTNDDQDYYSSYKYALSIAVGEKVKNRATDCIKHCEGEKISNICSCCKINNISKENSYTKIIYREKNRTWFPRRVEYQQATLSDLCFCDTCADKISGRQHNYKLNIFFAAGVAVFVVALSGDIITALFGGVAGYIFGAAAFSGGDTSIVNDHPTVKKHISEGWQLNEPTA